MNIEYNAVIEILKKFLDNEKIEILGISVGEERQVRDAIKNLLTAYEKEKDKNKKLKDKAKELIFEKQELTSGLLDSTPNDKIKAKIEELDKQEKEVLKGTKGQDRYAIKQIYQYKIQVLEELLGEEK